MSGFPPKTRSALKHYVYALVDPQTNAIFYVGKGNGNRAYSHLGRAPASNSAVDEPEKLARIAAIRRAGHEPRIEVLRFGLENDATALEVEAALIDAIGLQNLTNRVRGQGVVRGRYTAQQLNLLFATKPFASEQLQERAIVFFVHQTYSPTMSQMEIYDCVRQYWTDVAEATRIRDPETGELPVRLALGLVDGVVVGAYQIAGWFPGGTTVSQRGRSAREIKRKWEFVGGAYEEHATLGRRLTVGGQDIVAQQRGFMYVGPRS